MSATNINCPDCIYSYITFTCGHSHLAVISAYTCEHFRISRHGLGYCLRNPFPTHENVRLSEQTPAQNSTNKCFAIGDYQHLSTTARDNFDDQKEEYSELCKNMFKTPSLRYVVKELPNQDKLTLHQFVFAAEHTDRNDLPGPSEAVTAFDNVQECLDELDEKLDPMEEIAANIHQSQDMAFDADDPPPNEPHYAQLETEAEALSVALQEATNKLDQWMIRFNNAYAAFGRAEAHLKQQGRGMYEAARGSQRRWEVAKTWYACMMEPNEPPSELERNTQVGFDVDRGPLINNITGTGVVQAVGSKVWELEAAAPEGWDGHEDGEDLAELPYWEEIGTFSSLLGYWENFGAYSRRSPSLEFR